MAIAKITILQLSIVLHGMAIIFFSINRLSNKQQQEN